MKKVFTRTEIESLAFACRAGIVKKEELKQFFNDWEDADSINWNEWVGEENVLDKELDSIFLKKWMTEIEDQLDKELLDADE